MTFTAYIERQKSLIRSRHETEVDCRFSEGEPVYADTQTLLDELSSFKGLNTAERQECSKIFALN